MLPTDPDAVALSKGGSNHRRLSTAGDDVVQAPGSFQPVVGIKDSNTIKWEGMNHWQGHRLSCCFGRKQRLTVDLFLFP